VRYLKGQLSEVAVSLPLSLELDISVATPLCRDDVVSWSSGNGQDGDSCACPGEVNQEVPADDVPVPPIEGVPLPDIPCAPDDGHPTTEDRERATQISRQVEELEPDLRDGRFMIDDRGLLVRLCIPSGAEERLRSVPILFLQRIVALNKSAD
jgi:hypothetical protein